MVEEKINKFNVNEIKYICEYITSTKISKVKIILFDEQSFKIVCKTKYLTFEIHNQEFYKFISQHIITICRLHQVNIKRKFPFFHKEIDSIEIKQKFLYVNSSHE